MSSLLTVVVDTRVEMVVMGITVGVSTAGCGRVGSYMKLEEIHNDLWALVTDRYQNAPRGP